ncbi:hypothetical protein BGW80DRAFT_1449960 [Lactifluus volemus]|nr:hypothetical protein BGW80DRAFT_1449960 [Lactifluus volemus]
MIVQERWAAAKLWHAFDGIFLLPLLSREFFTTLDFEWSVIRGNRPSRWTIWVYSLTRIATLMTVILDIVELDVYTPISYQLWIIFDLIFSYFAVAIVGASRVLPALPSLTRFVFGKKGPMVAPASPFGKK